MSTRVVLLGKGGMLARAIEAELAPTLGPPLALDRSQLDLSRLDQIPRAIPTGTQWIINAAAYTDVDAAETHEPEATVINGDALRVLADRARELDATLVHFSTDYVFSGSGSTPYAVDAERQPINAYGRSKLKGERLLQASGAKYLLLRTSWLYAPWGKNFVRTLLNLVQTRPSLRVVADQVGRPTSVETLASGTLKLAARGLTGDFHLTDGGQCSWFEFATTIARYAQTECQVQACSSEEFPRPAKRPSYSVLDVSKTESYLGRLPDWQEPLRRALRTLLEGAVPLSALLATLSLVACSSDDATNEDMAPPAIDSALPIVELKAQDVESLCAWIERRGQPVKCADGSQAAHAARKTEDCKEAWPTDDCSAKVSDVTDCFASDPCDADSVAELCAGLVACSFGGGDEFTCDNGLSRVPQLVVCDGVEDCPDASDETDCGEL